MRSVLLQLHIGSPIRCESWSNVPVAHGVQISVYAEQAGGNPELLARRTHAALERELARLGAYRGAAPCVVQHGQIFPAHTCAGAVAGLAGRVLIFVADGSGRIDPIFQQYFSHPGTVVIPIVDTAITSAPQTVLPPFAATTLAEFTTSFDPEPIVPRLLRGAGIVTASVRLFISYRQAEAATVAGQLFHALAERGFAPFLDRFCSQPGDDFLDLIREELADKACLISLETAGIGQSLYCRQEVATAVSRRMGLIAVDFPGSVQTFNVIQKRIDATACLSGAQGELTAADLERIVDEIERHYAHEASRRPRWQDSNLYHAIMAAGLRHAAEGLGRYVVRSARGDRIVAMSPGLPQSDLFIEVETRRDALGLAGSAIFGPLAAAGSIRQSEIRWLSRKSRVDSHDEGVLFRYVDRLR